MFHAPDAALPPLPGAVGLTHLKVYDWPGADGLAGGSPHVHFGCTEAYYVVQGNGLVQTLDSSGFQETRLFAGQLVWFSPGVVHRLVNTDGALEILVVMQNSGLPEAGDFVLTFPREVLESPALYRQHAALDTSGAVFASSEASARARRDLALRGFGELRAQFDQRGPQALRDFYRLGLAIVEPQLGRWLALWEGGAATAAQQTGQQLQSLLAHDAAHLEQGRVGVLSPRQQNRLGMCGYLEPYLPEGKPK